MDADLEQLIEEADHAVRKLDAEQDSLHTLLDGLRREHHDGRDGRGGTYCAKIGGDDHGQIKFPDAICDCGADAHNARLDALRLEIVADRERAVEATKEVNRLAELVVEVLAGQESLKAQTVRIRRAALGDARIGRDGVDTEQIVCELREERDEFAVRWRSLLTELWEGVRAHGLSAPSNGRDGERLIHAYCGGIVKLRNALEDATKDRERAVAAMKERCAVAVDETDAPGDGHDQLEAAARNVRALPLVEQSKHDGKDGA